jgi:hypothetical protein
VSGFGENTPFRPQRGAPCSRCRFFCLFPFNNLPFAFANTWTGGENAVVFPRPGQTGAPPRRKASGMPSRFNWFESTPET